MGLFGLAGVWRLTTNYYSLPGPVSDFLYIVAAIVFVLLAAFLLIRLVVRPESVQADIQHPVRGPFIALFPISGMLLCIGLQVYAADFARILFLVFFLTSLLLGAWLTGQWMTRNLTLEKFHPGYFFPTVAGNLIGADGAARFGFEGLGWMSFGIGLVCWVALGSIILNRLFFYPALPAALIPTLAVEVAPPVVGGNAYFSLNGGKADTVAYMLAGYALLMVLVQLRMVPVYLKLRFSMGWWALAFTFAATASYTLRWIRLDQLGVAEGLSYLVLGVISVLIAGIAIRSLVLLWRFLFNSVSQPEAAEVVTSNLTK